MAASTQLAFRTLKGIGLLNGSPAYDNPAGFIRPEGNLRCSTYSPDGRFFAWASPEQVTIVNPADGSVLSTIPATNVYELGFSPLGTYIITWQRPSKDEEGNATRNLKVWQTANQAVDDTSVVGSFVQKSQTGWNLQYTSDERYCARVVTNEVQFYETANLGSVWNKLREEGVTDFALSPGQANAVAVFVPERKGQPAAVKVYNIPSFQNAVSQKTFFKGDKVQFKWNDMGTSLIVLAQTEVDKSNRSYYGETNLYVLSANGGFDSRIQLDKEGPIHDVTWSPTSKSFGVVYGYMPAKITIFDSRANPIHNFPLGPRNTILFSPGGRFVLVAGFGNLAGQMDIYDLTKDYAKVTTIEASNASVCEWAPDGKHILTATTSPRLRVDNGLKIWHVSGGLMYKEDMNELYNIGWRPQPANSTTLADPFDPAPIAHASALAYLGTVKTPSKPAGAYRPPGARGTMTPLHFKREDEGGAAYVNDGTSAGTATNGFAARRRRDVPGAETVETSVPGATPATGADADEQLSKAALKNRKKREARKAKERDSEAPNEDGGAKTSATAQGHVRQGSQSRGANGTRNQLIPGQPGKERSRSRGGRDNRSRSRGPNTASGQEQRGQNGRARAPAVPPGFAGSNARPRDQRQGQGQGHDSQHYSPQMSINIPTNGARDDNDMSAPDGGVLLSAATPVTPGSSSPHEKKVRALTKKLRAIDDLKMRQATGEKLELSQVSKINSEDIVRKELEALGITP